MGSRWRRPRHYNIDKIREPGVLYHRPEDGGLGFIVTLDGYRIFHAGDTDLVPEVRNVRADIALLPVSGVAVMTRMRPWKLRV